MVALFSIILTKYFDWFLVDRPKEILKIWKNFIVFGEKFFSIGHLIKTLFAPFHQYYESYGRGFDPQKWATAFFSNLIFRTLGAIVRLVIITLGVIFELFVIIFGALIFIGWFLFPVLIFLGFLFAIKLIVS